MNKGASPPRAPHPVDVFVGHQLRQRRILIGLSQQRLADQLGVTFQQLQKYENGTNRVSASRLYQLSRHLRVAVSYFFDGFAEGWACDQEDPLERRETLVLIRSYYRIPSQELRDQVRGLIQSLSLSVSRETENGETDGEQRTTSGEVGHGE